MNTINKGIPHEVYDPAYMDELPFRKLYVNKYEKVPSSYIFNKDHYNEKVVEHLLSRGFEMMFKTEFKNKVKYGGVMTMGLHNSRTKMIIEMVAYNDNNIDNSLKYSLHILYDLDEVKDIQDYITVLSLDQFISEKKKSSINLIKSTDGMLGIEGFDIKVDDLDIELNYGKDFQPVHDKIVERLNTPNDKGIILFHGDPGSGKTTYLRYLTKLIKDKDVLFVPPSLTEALSDPSIIPFLMEHKNTVLFIEDGEKVISDRQGINSSSVGVSNILNLTDGILGDCLSIQIVVTFNMDKEQIDSALLRKGRLIAEHKFGELSKDDSQRLMDHLGKEHKVEKGMVLADIYNIEEEVFTNKKTEQIGFR